MHKVSSPGYDLWLMSYDIEYICDNINHDNKLNVQTIFL